MNDELGGIRFGDWKLVPRDKINWELFRLRASKRGYGDGIKRWVSEIRYYQYDGFANAIAYAADVELKERNRDAAHDLHEALDEYRAITDKFLADLKETLG